jgi:UDP-N-acetylmuramoylalanine--D-glutamate ligase
MELRGKRVLVMGLGLQGSGMAAARYAAEQGAQVRVTDTKTAEALAPSVAALAGLPIEFVLGQHREEDFLWAEIVIRNPGVPRTSHYLQLAQQHGAQIEMEIALFFMACPGRIIGVTGTRGKTTTATLLYEIIKAAGLPTVLGGNVAGVETLSLLPQIRPETLVVLELSSWQLEGLAPHRLSPSVAVMTNIYPDHLNTYSSMEEYAEAKTAIFRYQKPTDLAIFNYDNEWTRRFGEEASGTTWFTSLDNAGYFARGSKQVKRFVFPPISIPGDHNLHNILLAGVTARLLGIPDDVIATTITNFKGVPHRLQEVANVEGVLFVNDTASTTPTSACAALRAYHTSIVLLAGGESKHLPLGEWPGLILDRCHDVVLLSGSGTKELIRALDKEIIRRDTSDPVRGVYDDFTQAMNAAIGFTQTGDVFLFSPGFTSFGMFANEFERGEKFIAYVRRLQGPLAEGWPNNQ